MAIDWLTVSAQVVNFLILVWLLKRFLYRPVLRAMERRETGIRERLEQAGQREAEAAASLQGYRQREAELASRREALFDAAEKEAEHRRHQWLEAARDEVAARRADWQRQWDEEREGLLDRVGQRALASVESVLRQALQELAGADLETRAVEVFIARLEALDDNARRSLGGARGAISVATSFAPSPEIEARLVDAVRGRIDATAEVRLIRSAELICGIELVRGGHRLGWSLADYLETLHERLGQDTRVVAVEQEAG
ncbi:F0F1 ATP synthase subunit B family protein [Halomonas organivorans]|uniref:ATP synthase subunit b n=1 Tax=Halomonas organivorans TaxID=257772 RepID=A0A7W5BU90_9GAMM|nr:hypothetical protein [Halomonas organivorans]MBB3139229.1 F-type H+-transporting ATPase subunit b [Halomonas organivorans]